MNNELQDNQHYTYRTLSQPTMLLGLPFRVMLTYVLTTFILFILLAMLKLITVWIVILMVLTYFVLRLLFGEDKFFFKAFKSNLKYVKGNSISNIISANIVWKQDKVKYDYLNSLLLRRYGKVNKPLVNRNYTKDKLVKK